MLAYTSIVYESYVKLVLLYHAFLLNKFFIYVEGVSDSS